MSLDDAIRQAVREAIRAEIPALLAELGRSRMLNIRELPVSHRLVLAAEKAGEIKVYRRGKFSAVDEGEFYDWLRAAPKCERNDSAEPQDDIGELIELGRRRTG